SRRERSVFMTSSPNRLQNSCRAPDYRCTRYSPDIAVRYSAVSTRALLSYIAGMAVRIALRVEAHIRPNSSALSTALTSALGSAARAATGCSTGLIGHGLYNQP